MKEGKPSTAKTSGGSGHWGLEAEVGMSRKALYWYVLAPKIYSFDFIAKADDDVFLRIPQYLCDLEHKVMPFAAALSVGDEDTHEHVDSGGNHVGDEGSGGIGNVRSKKCPPFNRMVESSRDQFQCGGLAADSIFSRIKAGFEEEEEADDHNYDKNNNAVGKENRVLKSDTDTLFIEHFRAQKKSNNYIPHRTSSGEGVSISSSDDVQDVNSASSTLTGRCPVLPSSVVIAHQGHAHVNQRPLNTLSGGIYWGKVMKWKAAKDDSSSEFLFVGGMFITMSRDVASLVASDEELYRMSGPFVFFDPEGVFEREKGSNNEIAVGFGEANAKQKRKRNQEWLFLRKFESVMSTAAQVKASTRQIFIKTTITKSGGGDEKEKNNENNALQDQHPDDGQIGGDVRNAAVVGSDGEPSSDKHIVRFVFVLPPVADSSSFALDGHGDGDGEGAVFMNAPPPPIAQQQQQQGRSNEGRRVAKASDSESADQDRSLLGVGGVGDMLSVVLRHSFLNSAVGGGTEASAKPIYKVRNMDHEDVMVGRSLYTRARAERGEEESEGGGGEGGDAFLAAGSGHKSNSNNKPTKEDTSINNMPLTFLKRAAITMANVSALEEFFPALKHSNPQQHDDSQRHLKPIAAAYTLRQALGIAIVDDCRYHDVHTGHNRAPITDKSVAIHHLTNAQYSELFARFSDDGQKEEESGERCKCLDTRMSDGFRRGHPIIRLC